jgi:hypothetical protein
MGKNILNEEIHKIRKMMGLGEDYNIDNEDESDMGEAMKGSAKYQFSQDLQDDPDHIQFKKDATYTDDFGGKRSFGTPNATNMDPFINKTKYSRVGSEDLTLGDEIDEGDLGDAKSDYYRKMDDWHRAKDKYEDVIWKEMFEYLLSLDMNRHEAWELIHTPEYTKQLKGKQAEWLKQNPEPKFTYDSGVQITKEQIIDILVTALEGGSNYWYLIKDVPKGVESDDMSLSEAIGEFILKGGEITIYDLEDEEEELGDLNMNKLLEAITIMKAEYPDMYQNLVNDEYDANDADIFFQIAVTGEVTFG